MIELMWTLIRDSIPSQERWRHCIGYENVATEDLQRDSSCTKRGRLPKAQKKVVRDAEKLLIVFCEVGYRADDEATENREFGTARPFRNSWTITSAPFLHWLSG